MSLAQWGNGTLSAPGPAMPGIASKAGPYR